MDAVHICEPDFVSGVVYDITSVTPDFIRKDYLKLTATARKAGENDVETNGGY